MKKITLLLATLFTSLQLMAVPAKPVKRTLTLSDGTTVTATLRGDEHYHFYVTDDGRALTEVSEGIYDYTDLQTETENWAKRRSAKGRLRQMASKQRRLAGKPRREFGVPGKVVGEKRGLVILVEFKNDEMEFTQQDFDRQFNEVGYSENKHIGSVRDYFKKQSYDQLTIDFDVVGPYPLKHEMAYYGRNARFEDTDDVYKFSGWSSNGDDVNAFEMVYEACVAANPDVNFKDYDWDDDGYVDQVYVIYNGYGEASTSLSNTIWPHEFELSQAAYFTGLPSEYPDLSQFAELKLDGVNIDTYACSNELYGITDTPQMDGIGTACHEFTHCLGIPDMYDIDNAGNFGMGEWDLMDYGSYSGPSGYSGSIPAAYTAYERWFSGWLEPTELDAGCYVSGMPAITDEPVCYVVYNQKNRNEYYLLQNIQQTSWNQYAGGHGMLVQHVFYDKSIWQANEVNTTTGYSGNRYQRCTVIPADNSLSSGSLAGDPFRNGTKTALTNTSTPKASLYVANSDGNKLMNRPIEDITERGGLISFTFNGGPQLDAPVANEVAEADLSETSFRATWSEVPDAASYTVELTEYLPAEEGTEAPVDINFLIDEDFSKMSSVSKQLSGTDLSNKLDDYTNVAGWSGTKVFSGYANSGAGGAKLGSGSATGSINTPQLAAPASGIITVLLTLEKYNNDDMNVTATVTPSNGTSTTQTYTESGTYRFTAEVSGTSKLTIATKSKRAFLLAVKVADGDFTTADMEQGSSTGGSDARTIVTTYTVEAPATEYLFQDLTQKEYSYRVQTVDADKRTSEWSNVVNVTLPTTETDIHCIPTLAADTAVEVYTLSGLHIRTAANSSSWSTGLPRGTYILKVGTSVRKVVK
jgi:M6 family metalloprotease-like protein